MHARGKKDSVPSGVKTIPNISFFLVFILKKVDWSRELARIRIFAWFFFLSQGESFAKIYGDVVHLLISNQKFFKLFEKTDS